MKKSDRRKVTESISVSINLHLSRILMIVWNLPCLLYRFATCKAPPKFAYLPCNSIFNTTNVHCFYCIKPQWSIECIQRIAATCFIMVIFLFFPLWIYLKHCLLVSIFWRPKKYKSTVSVGPNVACNIM